MSLTEKFEGFAKTNNLFPTDQPTLLAVSGGVDSVVMAHLFQASGRAFGIAHCNFQLRGAASDGDEVFVQQLAIKFGVPFFAKRFETKAYASKNGLSIQMAARELRYAWFREIAVEQGYAHVATGHHLNDSVETALLNFVRGTGLSGLGGLAPGPSPKERGAGWESAWRTPLSFGEGPGARLRPLLFATRADIEAYARENGIVWREDESNDSDDYARNFVRHHVVPLLEQLNPNFLHTAARNLARLRETDENLQFLLRHFFWEKPASQNEFYIEKQKLAQLPAPRRALRELLKNHGFSEEQARQVAENLEQTGLELSSDTGARILVDRGKIIVQPQIPNAESQIPNPPILTIEEDDLMLALPEGGRLILTPAPPTLPFPDGQDAVMVDAEKLCFPLLLRRWQPGDVFQPFGMKGQSQKLQDFFTNLKLSRWQKEKALVLENGDGSVVWVVGYRLDERFKVGADTKKILKISCL